MPFLDFVHVLAPIGWLKKNLAYGHVKEFAHTTKAFAPFALAFTYFETINVLQALHSLGSYSPFLDSLMDF
jgi:hypothetical protein